MTATREQLDSFHEFATDKLSNGATDMTIDELYELWRLENPPLEERSNIDAAIAEGLEDVAAGRYRPADVAMREIRSDFGIAEE